MPKFIGPSNLKLFRSELESPDLREFIKNLEQDVGQTAQDVLEFVRLDLLRFLKGYTNVLRPPDWRVTYYGGDPKAPRPAHPGGWADISGELAKGYKAAVTPTPIGWKLTVWNEAQGINPSSGAVVAENLAAVLESKHGFFVVSGLFEPGGVVEWTIARAIKRLTKGKWRSSVAGSAAFVFPTVRPGK